MKKFRTEQEEFWSGSFGDQYIQRNVCRQELANNLHLFGRILQRTHSVKSVVEFGANIGMNLRAISQLLPDVSCTGVEINQSAAEQLATVPNTTVQNISMFDFQAENLLDLALIKGVLIHINPDLLAAAYEVLYQSSRRYICLAEYYNPTPIEVTYRGHEARLYKRDFAGEMLEKYSDLQLVDYGFCYRRDASFCLDDITWFLLEKRV